MSRHLRILAFIASWIIGGPLVYHLTRVYHLTMLYWVSATLLFMWREKLPPERFGLTVRGLGASLSVGLLLAGACAMSAWLIAYWLDAVEVVGFSRVDPLILGGSLVWCLSVALTEELAFRGYLYTVLSIEAGSVVGALASSALFALMHSFNPGASWISALNIFLAGLLLTLIFTLRGSLITPVTFHAAWNYTLELLGSPVSGLVYGANILEVKLGDPTISGGEFGLEGGLAATLPLMVASAVLVVTLRGRRKQSV